MKKMRYGLTIALCIAPTLLFSAELPDYSLDDCLRIGLERATSLANAQRDEKIAEARIGQSLSTVLPGVQADGSYMRRDEVSEFDIPDGSGKTTTIEMGQLDNYAASFSAGQLLYSGGKARAAIKAARLYKDYARIGTQQTRAALIRDIKMAFYDILLAKANVSVVEDSVQQLREFASQTETKFKSETVSEFELLSAKVRLANEEPLLLSAQNSLAVAKEAFKNLIHLKDKNFDLKGELKSEPFAAELESLQAEGARNRPELLQMEKQVGLMEQDVCAARGDYYPSLRAVGSYTGQDPDQNEFGSTTWGWHWTAGLVAQWSLFDGGMRRGVVLEKNMNLAKAKASYEELKNSVALEIRQSFLDLQLARESMKGSQDTVKLAEKALSIAKTRYQQGLSTYLEFTETNHALDLARLQHNTALRDFENALARLQYACGTTPDVKGE